MGPNNNNETSQNEASEVEEPRNLTRYFLSQKCWFVFIYCVARAIHLLAIPGTETMPVHRLKDDDKATWERRWEKELAEKLDYKIKVLKLRGEESFICIYK